MAPFMIAAGCLLWGFWALSVGYLLALTLLAGINGRARRRHMSAGGSTRSFCLLIPAHNENLLIGEVLDLLHTLDYPPERYCIVVIADNCTDTTAEEARAHGAEVLERTDADKRGKGYALEWALNQLLPDPRRFDAFVILDADSSLSGNFLREMDSALDSGALAVQGYYKVLNEGESWRTRLMACALALAHYVKPMGRAALGLSDGLKGNGMCFARSVLEGIPWSGESITEDIEYTVRLVRAGIKIQFVPEAVVLAQMPVTGRQAATQRERWEGGRYALLKRAGALLIEGTRRRSATLMDRALDLIVPPFAELFAVPVLFTLAAGIWLAFWPVSAYAGLAFRAWGAILAGELIYLGLGLAIARVPLRTASALVFAPIYIVWKLALYAGMALRGGAGGWKRTDRQAWQDAPAANNEAKQTERLTPNA